MMDRGKTEREREEVFAATREGYRVAMENTFALQERTLSLARNLLESSTETSREQADNNRQMLEELAEQSRRQRQALDDLIRESSNAYTNLLWAPFTYYREVVEAMASGAAPRARPDRGLPLADYDSLNVDEVANKLQGLGVEEIKQLRAYEVANKNRATLVERFDKEIGDASS